jgi:peptide/nickel transport system substrate-binding protein
MISSILAGATDVLLPQGPDVEAALEIKRRWEGTGNRVSIDPNGTIRYIQFQHRPEYQRPRNGFSQRLVRQAFTNATDRQAGVDVTTEGTAMIAESWFPPTDRIYTQIQAAIPRYPFDLNLAQQRLAQAGWVKNSQGELVHQPSGERFELEFRGLPGSATERLVATILDTWKASGAQPEIKDFPPAIASDPEFRVTFPGAGITGNVNDMFSTGVLDSRQMATAATRWVGNNRSGYSNPAMNALYDRLNVTIEPNERVALQRSMVEEAMGDAAFIPLYFDVAPVFSLRGVRNIGEMVDNSSTWNMFEWNKE